MFRQALDSNWFFSRLGEESQKRTVNIPHDAMLAEPRAAEWAGGTNTGWFAGRDYVYEKTFTAPIGWTDRDVILEFEGVYHNAEVWLNGEQIASHTYGYTGFYVPLTGRVRLGVENTLRVVARNSDQPNSRYYTGAGIYRPVWLHVLPREHLELDGVKIHTTDWKDCAIHIDFVANCAGEVRVEILDRGTPLAAGTAWVNGTGSLDLALPGAKLWSPDCPYLYTCRVKFGEDVRKISFGVRFVSCDTKHGFCLNGQRVILRGACIHHDNGILGAVCHPTAETRKIRLLKQAGYNAIRSAHNPCSKALLEACDKLGMLVMDEYADMWYIHKTHYDYAADLPNNWRDDLRDIVDKDCNHPSVVMYSIGNEVSETAQPRGIQLTGEMTEYLHQLDDRPVTCGINIFFNFLSSMGLGVYSDKKAKEQAKKAQKRKGKPVKEKAVGSEFFNNLAGILGADFMKFGATLRGSDCKTKEAFAKLDVAGYNYGEMRYLRDFRKYPDRVIVGSETFCADAARFWDLAKDYPALVGDFVWAGIDYLGEVGIGAWEHKDYAPEFSHGPGWLTAGAGVLDLTGAFTGQTAYTQVAFELSPIRIGVVPVPHAFEPHSPSAWRMSNTFESWAWNGCEGKETRVEVYARGEKVALQLNGKTIGKRRLDKNYRCAFRVPWRAGELTAIVYGADGKELGRAAIRSAGEETRLSVLPEQAQISTDELCYVRLCFTDLNGAVKPLARADVTVRVKGGTLLALGSACPYNERGYLTDTTDTYYGQALAVIRPNGPGAITIQAESRLGCGEAQVLCAERGEEEWL